MDFWSLSMWTSFLVEKLFNWNIDINFQIFWLLVTKYLLKNEIKN
jgi:hypothetical protein